MIFLNFGKVAQSIILFSHFCILEKKAWKNFLYEQWIR